MPNQRATQPARSQTETDNTTRPDAAEIEAVVTRLLTATEVLHRVLTMAGDESDIELDLDALGLAAEERAAAVVQLEAQHSPATWAPNPAVRSCLTRIRELDQEILALGASSVTSARGAQHAAQRKRAVIHAQHSRGRDEPRLITVKA